MAATYRRYSGSSGGFGILTGRGLIIMSQMHHRTSENERAEEELTRNFRIVRRQQSVLVVYLLRSCWV